MTSEKYLPLLPKSIRIGLLCILPAITGILYRFVPTVPENVTLKTVSETNQIFKQSFQLSMKEMKLKKPLFTLFTKMLFSKN